MRIYNSAILLVICHLSLQGLPASADAGWITSGGSAHLIEDKTASMPMHDPRKHIRGSFLSFSVDGKKIESEVIEVNWIKDAAVRYAVRYADRWLAQRTAYEAAEEEKPKRLYDRNILPITN